MKDLLDEWAKIKILTGDFQQFLEGCKLVLVRRATENGHNMVDILQHYYHSSTYDASYLLYCSRCPFEITIEYIELNTGEQQLNLFGDTEIICPQNAE